MLSSVKTFLWSFLKAGFLIRFFTVIAFLGVIGAGVATAVAYSGVVSFAATSEDPRWLYRIIHGSFKRSVANKSSDIEVPEDLDDPGRIALGAQHFAQNCTRCHGAPGIGQNPQVLGMKPAPQHLPAVVDQFDDAELFWILRYGVMMSAMPPWPADGYADEIWSTVAFIRQLDDMTPEAYVELTQPPQVDAPAMAWQPPLDQRQFTPTSEQTYPPEEHLYTSPTSNWADYAYNEIPVRQCAACHGTEGDGAPTYGKAPNLSILSSEYISEALQAYAGGQRNSGIMQVVATQLTEEQIFNLADYYSGLPDAPSPGGATHDEATLAVGERIASLGRPDDGMPACAGCHNAANEGAGELAVPSLAGQSSRYIQTKLRRYRAGVDDGAALWNPMPWVAGELSDAEIQAVAAWYSTQEAGREVPVADLPENPEAAETLIATVCVECHQGDMAGVPSGEYPNLTLQSGSYTLGQLHAFYSYDRRQSERMQQTAQRLEFEEMTHLSAYIDRLPAIAVPGAATGDGDPINGAEIAQNGLPGSGVPACLTCHGAEPTERLELLPRLHGQYSRYLERRLRQFSSADPIEGSPMTWIASRMSAEERADVAAYFASQAPLDKFAQIGLDGETPEMPTADDQAPGHPDDMFVDPTADGVTRDGVGIEDPMQNSGEDGGAQFQVPDDAREGATSGDDTPADASD